MFEEPNNFGIKTVCEHIATLVANDLIEIHGIKSRWTTNYDLWAAACMVALQKHFDLENMIISEMEEQQS